MNRKLLGLILATILVSACTPHWGFIPISSSEQEKLPPECALKGACILVNDTYIEQSIDLWNKRPLVSLVLHQEIAIVNEYGYSYATIPLQGIQRFATQVELFVKDSTGKVVYTAPSTALMQLWTTGNIAVPNVAPGYRINLTVKGVLVDILDDEKFEVNRDLPVLRTRFTLATYNPVFAHATREQGYPKPKNISDLEDDENKFKVFRKEYGPIYPPQLLPHMGLVESREPAIRVALDRCTLCNYTGNDWRRRLPAIQPDYLWQVEKHKAQIWQRPIFDLVDSLQLRKLPEDSARKALYAFIQEEFTVDSFFVASTRSENTGIFTMKKPMDLGEVVKTRSGSPFAISSVYGACLLTLGQTAEIMVAGSIYDNGIDFTFPSKQNQLFWMVRVKEKNGYRALVPHMKGYRYGNYPIEIDQRVAVVVGSLFQPFTSVAIPNRIQDSLIYDVNVQIDSMGNAAEMKIIPSGLGMDYLRNFWLASNPGQRETKVLNWFSSLPNSFSLASISADGVDDFRKPFSIWSKWNTTGLVRKSAEGEVWRVGLFLESFYEGLDSVRNTNSYMPSTMVYREHIYLPPGVQPKQIKGYCDSVQTTLLTMQCSVETSGLQTILHRNVVQKAGAYSPMEIRKNLPGVYKTNQVRESYLVMN